MAAQMLSGKGFKEVYNLTGGFNGWNGEAAFGGEEMGLPLFTGAETPEETLVTAYSLEEGLREFYLLMEKKTTSDDAKKLFRDLSEIEVKHQDRIFAEYIEITGEKLERSAFEENIVSEAMEGGMTTEEYVDHF
ncbi:MAG: sulfurtransferase, partial [Desulfobacterales bacterium]|nr:sulfurtransferase [Desulfobacterales bacterium]